MAAVSKRGRGRKALNAVTENDVNISAGNTEISEKDTIAAILSPSKAKNAKSKKKVEASTETSAPAFVDELEKLQAQLQQLQIEKSKTEEMLKEKDEILKKKDEEQEKLQAELKKLQRVKEFKPTVSFPLVKSLVEKEQEGKDKKKKNNKSTLKKPCPAYALWLKDQWTEIKQENPEVDFKEISNSLAAKWKGVSAEEKKPYEDKYQEEKEAYLQVVGKEKREIEAMKLLEEDQMQKTAMELLEQYLKYKQEADDLGKKKSRKEKDPLKPKQPMSAFFIFSNERRATLLAKNKNVVEVAKITGEEWKAMSEKKKAPYEEIARKQKEEYKQQMEIYNQKKLKETAALEKEEEEQKKLLRQEALQLLKKKEKTENIIKKTKENRQKKKQKEESDPNKPKKPASSFILFSKETRKQLQEERPDTANSTINALITVKWKELSEEEKQKWNAKAAEGMAEYKKEMEEYNKSKPSTSN
ncbi:high mobility group [Rhynchospora pubera]|uniref:High mobility group n=1 Tax=Rhynchospora pubera TaxID=906938 RepID=A0AAV8DL67_9POAL|nr:high mobility group [Rhynchospora pubera]